MPLLPLEMMKKINGVLSARSHRSKLLPANRLAKALNWFAGKALQLTTQNLRLLALS